LAEADPVLRRIERGAICACLAMAAVAWPIARFGVAAPLGVLGGGLLVAISYRGIKTGIDVLVSRATGADSERGGVVLPLVKFFTRFGILALAAYVIMARLRLPPVAVFAGASSFVVAVAVEAIRGGTPKSPSTGG
jgi:hypothetical protein